MVILNAVVKHSGVAGGWIIMLAYYLHNKLQEYTLFFAYLPKLLVWLEHLQHGIPQGRLNIGDLPSQLSKWHFPTSALTFQITKMLTQNWLEIAK